MKPITIETVCDALETAWRVASDSYTYAESHNRWDWVRSKIEGMQDLLIYIDLDTFKVIEEDLHFLWQVSFRMEDVTDEHIGRAA